MVDTPSFLYFNEPHYEKERFEEHFICLIPFLIRSHHLPAYPLCDFSSATWHLVASLLGSIKNALFDDTTFLTALLKGRIGTFTKFLYP